MAVVVTHDHPESEEPGGPEAALDAFQQAHPAYDAERLHDLRAREYGRLDEQGHVYLDYTGGSLYAESQLRAHLDLLRFVGGFFDRPNACAAVA